MTLASRTKSERDLDLVLVTGAGASREFGVSDRPMPLMADWSESIMEKLSSRNIFYLEASGLQPDMTGPEFETQLGKFLHQAEAFPLIESLLEPSVNFQALRDNSLSGQGVLQNWHQTTAFHVGQIIELIRESLFEEFSNERWDGQKAARNYAQLLQTLGIRTDSRWVYATTNYDASGEASIGTMGLLPDWGHPNLATNVARPPVRVTNLLDGIPRYVPVLHLHGRVGWYRQTNPSGQVEVYVSSNSNHSQGFGVPVVMLPDPNKVYDSDDVISVIWSQFLDALRRAKKVLLLGHSLNDKELVNAIAANVEPLDRVGAVVLAEPEVETMKTIQQNLGNAGLITMRFGTTDEDEQRSGLENLRQWIARLDEAGLT